MKKSRFHRRLRSGQSVVETTVAMILVMFIFCALVQISYLFMGKMIANHAAFVAARSNAVGFKKGIVSRAIEVGSIGMSGHLQYPEDMAGRPPGELGMYEEVLIKDFIQAEDYTLWYEHWPVLTGSIPSNNIPAPAKLGVHMHSYPLQMPMHRAYINSDIISFGGNARILNHAAFYLE